MKISRTLSWLSVLVAVLAVAASAAGLFAQDPGRPFAFTTIHGQTADMYGHGLYRFDTVVTAVGYLIADWFTLLIGVPLLIGALWLYRRGSVRGGILLAGVFAYLLYKYVSMAVGAAYNNWLLAYIVLTGATFLGLVVSLMSFDTEALASSFGTRAPWRGIAIFLIVSGASLFSIWLFLSIVPALLANTVPLELASYSTVTTFGIDMGFVAPSLIAAGILLLRREPLGFVLAPMLLIYTDVLGVSLMAMGIGQELMGLMSVGQFIGFVVSFAILALVGIGFTVGLFRSRPDSVMPSAVRG